MSEYLVCETRMRDEEALVSSLVELGIARENIQIHEQPVPLVGYEGDARKQRAHIVVRRKHVGAASNDIGFIRNADGNYEAWVSEFDKRRGIGKEIWQGRLKALYTKSIVNSQLAMLGMQVLDCREKNGQIHIAAE